MHAHAGYTPEAPGSTTECMLWRGAVQQHRQCDTHQAGGYFVKHKHTLSASEEFQSGEAFALAATDATRLPVAHPRVLAAQQPEHMHEGVDAAGAVEGVTGEEVQLSRFQLADVEVGFVEDNFFQGCDLRAA